MKDTYVFPSIFHAAPDGISVSFPDLPGCLPCADDFETAFKRAKEALQLHIYGMEEDGETIPSPSPVKNIEVGANEIITVIEVYRRVARRDFDHVGTSETSRRRKNRHPARRSHQRPVLKFFANEVLTCESR